MMDPCIFKCVFDNVGKSTINLGLKSIEFNRNDTLKIGKHLPPLRYVHFVENACECFHSLQSHFVSPVNMIGLFMTPGIYKEVILER